MRRRNFIKMLTAVVAAPVVAKAASQPPEPSPPDQILGSGRTNEIWQRPPRLKFSLITGRPML